MKKNTMMRIASVLMVAVLLSTCAISSTFAKYVTSGSDGDTARIAKWGVRVSVSAQDAFTYQYDKKEDSDITIAKTVISASGQDDSGNVTNGDDVLAPGTSGVLLQQAQVTGTPEVAVNVSRTADLDIGDKWEVDDVFYCPLIINGISGLDYASADDFEADVARSLTTSDNYAANAGVESNVTVSWSWAFDGDDVKDTALGNKAAEGNAPTISFTYTIEVTQLD